MTAVLYHLQLNVADAARSIPFYKACLGWLGFDRVLDEGPAHLGIGNGHTDLWVMQTEGRHRAQPFHRKRGGLNHVAFRVPSREDVDRFHREFLQPRRIPTLYGSPKAYPEYREGYYAVFFEDPDRLKLEVAFVPERR